MDDRQLTQLWSRLRAIEKKLDSFSDTANTRLDYEYTQSVIRQELAGIYIILREFLDLLCYTHDIEL